VSRSPVVAVIGAGWAGLSAALRLAEAGRSVVLLESHALPGGRARSLDLHGARLDNGQHILVGACRQALEQIRRVGVDPDAALLALPFGLSLRESGAAPVAIAPRSAGMLSMARALLQTVASEPISVRIQTVLGAARMFYPSRIEDRAVQQWLQSCRQPERLIRSLWEPLCVAVMNTPVEVASAAVFQRVLRQTLLAQPEDARLLIPRVPLGQLFPEPALERLRQLGAEILMQSRVTAVAQDASGRFRIRLRGRVAQLTADQVIVATAPKAANRLLPQCSATAASRHALATLGHRSICTVFLRYRNPLDELPALTGLLGQQGQWLIPRAISGEPHWVAVVISTADDIAGAPRHVSWESVSRELAETFPELGLAAAGFSVCERAATFDCRVGIDARRPTPETGIPGLVLAGDYTAMGLPSTLEAAVQGGLLAANRVLNPAASAVPLPGCSRQTSAG